MNVKVGSVKKDTKCQREVRLSPAGVPVYCTSKAVMSLNGLPLCAVHAKEAQSVLESMAKVLESRPSCKEDTTGSA
jgi:hypothetical protein